MAAMTDYFEKLQREHYKNPKRDNRLAMLIWLFMVGLAAIVAAGHR